MKLLQEFNLLGKLHRGILGNLESKSFISIRLQIYNQKKSKKMDAEKRARFKQNILACDEGSVVEDLMSMKHDIRETGDSLQEVKDYFLFFIDYLIDEQVALQCLQMDSKTQIKKNQNLNASKMNIKAESYNKPLSKKPFQKNSILRS